MKILAALKQIKIIDRKIAKFSKQIMENSSYFATINLISASGIPDPTEAPIYNTADLNKKAQAVQDLIIEKARLQHCIHATNIATIVEFKGNSYSIDELLTIQNTVLPAKIALFKCFSKKSGGYGYNQAVKVFIQYSPKEMLAKIEDLESESEELNLILDEITYSTDLIEE